MVDSPTVEKSWYALEAEHIQQYQGGDNSISQPQLHKYFLIGDNMFHSWFNDFS